MNIGIIGAGAIATYVLHELQQSKEQKLTVTSLFVRDRSKYEQLAEKYNVQLYTDIDEFLEGPIDVVVEAANILAVTNLLSKVIQKKDVVVISIGALAEETFLQKVKHEARAHDRTIYLPSGAIGGLDLIQNASTVGAIEDVTLETRKPAHTLVNERIDEAQVIFTGTATDAIKKYPANMNVSIALALSGIGFDKTKVTIIADPTVDTNVHTIEASGKFGDSTFTIANNPLEENPNTSYLAAVSVIGTLKRMMQVIKIGS